MSKAQFTDLYLTDRVTKDACGTAVWLCRTGPTHETIVKASASLESEGGMAHRKGRHPQRDLSDGSGLRAEIPWTIILRDLCGGHCAYPRERCGVLTVHIARQSAAAADDLLRHAQACLHEAIAGKPIEVLGWRHVPLNQNVVSADALLDIPEAYQVLIADTSHSSDFAREVWLTGRRMQALVANVPIHVVDGSVRYTTYKGNFPDSLAAAYPDLRNPEYLSREALIHTRFATRSFPWSWLVHPFGFVGVGHNGEVTNLDAFKQYCRALQRYYEEHHLLDERLYPFIPATGSDSYVMSQWIMTLMLGGQDFTEILFGMLPILKKDPALTDEVRRTIEVISHSAHQLMGPVALAFAVERFGGNPGWVGFKRGSGAYRPGRAFESVDGQWFYAGSEATGLDELSEWREIRIGAGEMIAFSDDGQLYTNDDLLRRTVDRKQSLIHRVDQVKLLTGDGGDSFAFDAPMSAAEMLGFRHRHGHHRDLDTFFLCCQTAKEPLGAMGRDIPMPGLEPWRTWVSGGEVNAPLLNLDTALAQGFNQQTAPAVDNRVESHLVQMGQLIGFRPSPLDFGVRRNVRGWHNLGTLFLSQPALMPDEWRALRARSDSAVVEIGYELEGGPAALEEMLERVEREVVEAAQGGSNFILLDDVTPSRLGIGAVPPPIIASVAFTALVKAGLERRSSLFLRTGAPVLSHTLAAGIAFGLTGIFPEVMYRRIADFAEHPRELDDVVSYAGRTTETRSRLASERAAAALTPEAMMRNYRETIVSELVEIMAQVGITDIDSYRAGRNFYGSGMTAHFAARWLGGITQSMEGPIDLTWIHAHNLARHARLRRAQGGEEALFEIPDYGIYKALPDSELDTRTPRRWTREMTKALRGACDSRKVGTAETRQAGTKGTREFEAALLRIEQITAKRAPLTACDLLTIDTGRPPIAEEEVEVPIQHLMVRFIPEHMSAGALNVQVRRQLNEGMAQLEDLFGLPFLKTIGEGGTPRIMREGPSVPSSAQLGSRRWGVHPYFLWRAREVVLKWVQGAKQGRGGHLPKQKNYGVVTETRDVPEGVELISPPPHHDMYSIEDHYLLARTVKALQGVLWVSKFGGFPGIGSDCLGAIKCLTDIIHLCGPEGGTGAAKEFASIYGTGSPLFPSIIEAQHTMRAWDVRHLVKLRADGGMDGIDSLKYMLLGIEQFGVGTGWLIGGFGCAMFRVCNHAGKEGCPVFIARNDAPAVDHFLAHGNPADVVNMAYVLARLLRRQMAAAGLKNLDGVIGMAEYLQPKSREIDQVWKLSGLLDQIRGDKLPGARCYTGDGKPRMPEPPARDVERVVIGDIAETVKQDAPGRKTFGPYRVSNEHLGFGARLTGEMFNAHPELQEGIRNAEIRILTEGYTQAYGAFNTSHRLVHTGILFDNVGLMSRGGSITVLPPSDGYRNGLVGSNLGAFATGGRIHVRGPALDRCGVCLQGAVITVEGVGDMAFEYMTSGKGLILHPDGWNCPIGAGAFLGSAAGVVFIQSRTDDSNRILAGRTERGVSLRRFRPGDQSTLLGLLELHRNETNSPLAQQVLDGWEVAAEQFWVLDPNSELERKAKVELETLATA